MTIEAVCWDVGGVFTPRPVDAVAALAADHDVDPDELWAAVFGPYHLDGDHPWHRLERGELPLVEAWPHLEAGIGGLGIDLELRDLFAAFGRDETDRTVVADTARALHGAGVRMAVITNNVREFSEAADGGWRKLVPMECFAVVVDSSAVGMRKPDHAIYRHALAELGVDAAATAFVDDIDSNVAAARELGLHGIVVGAQPGPAMAELRALVGV